MSNNIKINCRKVYDTGLAYEDNAQQLSEIKKSLEDISSSVQNAWNGVDSTNFINKLNNHISSLDYLISFLNDKGKLLKNKAVKHNAVDNEFLSRIRRSDIDEYLH